MPTTLPVLSDIDGVLIDSSETEAWGWTNWAAGHGLDPEPFVSTQGMRIEEKLARFAPHLPAGEAARVVEIATACPFAAKPLPGAARLLATTPTIALVTSGARAVVIPQLQHAGLQPPPVVVTAEDVEHGKPDPAPYLTAAQRLGVSPWQCIVLEDAPAGVTAGVAAGMVVVAVATTSPRNALLRAGARLVVPDVAGFLACREAGSLPLSRP
jgi:sugar-phosphatase